MTNHVEHRRRARARTPIAHWGEGYFDVDAAGRLIVRPRGADGPALALPEIVERACAKGSRLPLLVRFADILRRPPRAPAGRIRAGDAASGATPAATPRSIRSRSISRTASPANWRARRARLRSGSRLKARADGRACAWPVPAASSSAMATRIANTCAWRLIGRKLGLRVFIVIEKPSELEACARRSEGARASSRCSACACAWPRSAQANGRTPAATSRKFGLSPRQLLTLIDQLERVGPDSTLQLLHFHMGSQISNVRDIATGMREATRYFVELCKLGVPIRYRRCRRRPRRGLRRHALARPVRSTMALEQYAATIVQPLAEACAEQASAAACDHRNRPRDDRAPRGAGDQRHAKSSVPGRQRSAG